MISEPTLERAVSARLRLGLLAIRWLKIGASALTKPSASAFPWRSVSAGTFSIRPPIVEVTTQQPGFQTACKRHQLITVGGGRLVNGPELHPRLPTSSRTSRATTASRPDPA